MLWSLKNETDSRSRSASVFLPREHQHGCAEIVAVGRTFVWKFRNDAASWQNKYQGAYIYPFNASGYPEDLFESGLGSTFA